MNGNPRVAEYRLALATVEEKSGNKGAAERLIASGRRLAPDSKPLALGHVRLLENQNNYRGAEKILQTLVRNDRNDPKLLLLLSRAEGKNNKLVDAHGHLADYYYLRGELKSAMRQLEIALGRPETSDYQSAKLAARLKNIKHEFREQEKLRNKR
jgi:predicted Zn-dependent protease